MNGALPNPNVEPSPGQRFDDASLAAKFREIQENLDALALKFPVSGGDLGAAAKAIRNLPKGGTLATGEAVATWEASQGSVAVTVAHGLAVIPRRVWTSSRNWPLSYAVESRDATNLVIVGGSLQAPLSGSFTFEWFALA